MVSDSTILLVGLAETGKTNFLVGLDIVLDNQQDPDGLRHTAFARDREYLQPLRQQWMRAEVFRRTERAGNIPAHQLIAIHEPSSTRITFKIPDIAGESFNAQFVTRSVSIEFADSIRTAAGIMLFLHLDEEAEHAILQDPSFIDTSTVDENACQLLPSHGADWQPENASRQVKLVDLLQFMGELREGLPALRVAVAISAWDRIERIPAALEREIPKIPDQFLIKRWPLLSQFLEGNLHQFQSRVFGVSARGGGTTPEEIARLIGIERAVDRISVVEGKQRTGDLSRPVRWLMGLL